MTARPYPLACDREDGSMGPETRQQLLDLAGRYPVGARVVHTGGRSGTVVADVPAHVPGRFLSTQTTVCLAPVTDEPHVFVSWDNEAGLVWKAWVPVSKVNTGDALTVNRPGNTARIGASR